MKAQIELFFAYVAVAALMFFAFRFLAKERYRTSMGMDAVGVIVFLLAILFGAGVSSEGFKVEQILCWMFATFLCYKALQFIEHDKLPYAFVLSLVAAAIFFCGLSGVQSLLKTHVLGKVTESLNSYGEKIDKFQTTVNELDVDMRVRQRLLATNQFQLSNDLNHQEFVVNTNRQFLEDGQMIIKQSQADIFKQLVRVTNEFDRLTSLRADVEAAQAKIMEQQTNLDNVQYLISNLYSNMVYETISANDPNKCLSIPESNGVCAFYFKLDHVPIQQSLQVTIVGGENQGFQKQLRPPSYFIDNVVGLGLKDYDPNTLQISFQYVKDARSKNGVNRMFLTNGYPVLDSRLTNDATIAFPTNMPAKQILYLNETLTH